jgi:CrcB protein
MTGLWLALAGGVGAGLRYLVDTAVTRHLTRGRQLLPWGLLLVNLTGCLALGLLVGWTTSHPGLGQWPRLVGVGLLGGYTTFSAACLVAAQGLIAARAKPTAAIGAVLVMPVGCLTAAAIGLVVFA